MATRQRVRPLRAVREQLKIGIVDESPFSLMEAVQQYALFTAGSHDIIDLSRGSPSHIYSRPSAEGKELLNYLRSAVINLSVEELRHIERDDIPIHTLEGMLKSAANKDGGTVFVQRASINLHEVIGYLVSRSGVNKREQKNLTLRVYRELIRNCLGTPYGNKKGLDITKLYFKDILGGAGLEERIADEFLSHENVLITQGVSQGIDTFFASSHFERGDYVIAITPFYPPYQRQADMHGLNLIPITSDSHGRLDLDLVKALEESIRRLPIDQRIRIKSLVIIDPSNPTGHTLTTEEQKALARLADPSIAPNLIIASDNVYEQYSRRFRFIGQVVPNAPVIYFYSVSKAEKDAGLRVGAMYVSKSAELRLGVLRNFTGRKVNAYDYFAESKGGTSEHTSQAATLAQIDAALSGTFDRLHSHISGFSRQLSTTRRKAYDILGVEGEEMSNGSNYYFWLNIRDYVSSRIGRSDKRRQYILQNLDVPEVILRMIERHGIIIFGGSSFFPKEDIPGILQGTPYSRKYHQEEGQKPEWYIRASLPNTSPEIFLDAMKKLKETIDEHVKEIRQGDYKPAKKRRLSCIKKLDAVVYMDYVRSRLVEIGADPRHFRRRYSPWCETSITEKLGLKEPGDTSYDTRNGGILLEDVVELHKTPKGELFRVRYGIKQKTTVKSPIDPRSFVAGDTEICHDGKPEAFMVLEGFSPINGNRWEFSISTMDFFIN